MLIDAQCTLSDAQAVTATAASANTYDTTVPRNIGVGADMYALCIVQTAMTDTGSDSTVTVTLETDDNSGFSSATTAQTLGTFAAVSPVGTKLVAKLQPNKLNERYIRGMYTVAGGNLTTGSFHLSFVSEADLWSTYPDAITITG
jgi:hypothetical protein